LTVPSAVEGGKETRHVCATPLPMFLDEAEGPHGVLYGHLVRANPQ
jgi:predicted FMN-binding regulatory protein PaiB